MTQVAGITQCLSFSDWPISLSLSLQGSFLQSMAGSATGLLEIMLQWPWGCKVLFKILLSVLLDMDPEVRFLDQMTVLLIFGAITMLFSLLC